MSHKPGDIIDSKYQILERLGAGGMGEVYKAVHTYLGATRVIKVVHPQISSNEDAKSRFLREARAATKVQHTNVATLHDFSSLPDGSHYMVWEYIDGENLAQRLRARGTLPPAEAVSIVVQALRGLDAIHHAGIIHRDISPENIMILHDRQIVKIIDLGVAKVDDTADVASTKTGIFVGKLRYASPEQLGFLPEGQRIDARTDLYSIGMVLFELLTGRPPYEAKSPHEYFMLHAREELKRTIELPANLPGGPALRKILEQALARDRELRFASATAFAAALEHVPLTDDTDATRVVAPSVGDATRVIVKPVPPPDPALTATTVRTPMPAPIPPRATEPPRRSLWPLLLVIAFVFLATLGGIAAVLLWPKGGTKNAGVVPAPVVQADIPAPAPSTTTVEASTTTVDVVTTTSPPSTTGTTTAPAAGHSVGNPNGTVGGNPSGNAIATPSAPTAAVRQEPAAPAPQAAASTRPAAQPQPSTSTTRAESPRQETASSTSSIAAYVDGGEDGETNERVIGNLRRELAGVRKVTVHGGAMQTQLEAALREEFPWLELADGAPVVIRFEGVLESLGRGRKKRAATATIVKNGRVVFRYQLPEQVFRVGMHPHEAFVNVLSDAVEQPE